MSLFLTAFAASALAQMLFSRDTDLSPVERSIQKATTDLSNQMDRLAGQLNQQINVAHDDINRQLAIINDSTAFMKARMCLMDFNPKLLGNPCIGPKCHTIEAIQAAATEGFQLLLDTAMASSDGYKEACQRFDETYGNYQWVQTKWGDRINKYNQYEKMVDQQKLWSKKRCDKISQILDHLKPVISEILQHAEKTTQCMERLHTYKQTKRFVMERLVKRIHLTRQGYSDELLAQLSHQQNLLQQILKELGDYRIYIPNLSYLLSLTEQEYVKPISVALHITQATVVRRINSCMPDVSLPKAPLWDEYQWKEPYDLTVDAPRYDPKPSSHVTKTKMTPIGTHSIPTVDYYTKMNALLKAKFTGRTVEAIYKSLDTPLEFKVISVSLSESQPTVTVDPQLGSSKYQTDLNINDIQYLKFI